MITDFQVMHEMAENDNGVFVIPLENIKKCKLNSKEWGEITIAVPNDKIQDMIDKKFVGGLYLVDKQQFFLKIDKMILESK